MRDYNSFTRIAAKSVDVLLLDPPYNYNISEIIENVVKAEILKENYIIVIESDKPYAEILNNVTMKSYKYGITFVTIIRGKNL